MESPFVENRDPVPTPYRRSRRLFVCLTLPDYVRDSLTRLYGQQPGFNWTRPEQLHLTLRFIGEVDPPLHREIERLLASIEVEPFFLPIEGIRTFSVRGKPSTVWIGTGSGHPRLYQLRMKIENALVALGIEADTRAWNPHITLARTRQASTQSVRRWVRQNREFEAPPIRVSRFHLLSSEIQDHGSLYSEETSWELLGRAV